MRASCTHHTSAPAPSRPFHAAVQRATLALRIETRGPGWLASPTRTPRAGHPTLRAPGGAAPSSGA
eukprot:10401212-Lingulodinium_polyedra.AAC.1